MSEVLKPGSPARINNILLQAKIIASILLKVYLRYLILHVYKAPQILPVSFRGMFEVHVTIANMELGTSVLVVVEGATA